MGIITYSRDSYCKDCSHCRYYYNGKRKLHKCIKLDRATTLRDKARGCINNGDFEWNPIGITKEI